MASIELVNIVKLFGAVRACANIQLHVANGEFVTLLGPSGCGKTTLLHIIAGLEEATSGEIRIGGQVVNQLSPFERDVAMVFQNYALYPHMTVEENIGFSLHLRKCPKEEIRTRVSKVAQMLELEHLLARLPRELSGGQQQRVAIGRAVIREPAIFLFDEPFSNLDAALRVRMRSEVKELHQRLNVTSIFVTHDQEEALSLSDRVAVLRAGEVEQYGTPAEVYSRPASKYVARFIGSPQLDIFSGVVESQDGQAVYRVGDLAVTLPANQSLRGDNLDLGVRPEHVSLGEMGTQAQVRLVQPVGPFTYVTVDWEGGSATARISGISLLRPKDRVHVAFDPMGVLLFDRESERLV